MGRELVRTVSYFDKATEEIVGQLPLHGVHLSALQAIFQVEPDDPMYDVWPIGPEEAEALKDHVEGSIELDRYDYFLDCYTPAGVVATSE